MVVMKMIVMMTVRVGVNNSVISNVNMTIIVVTTTGLG